MEEREWGIDDSNFMRFKRIFHFESLSTCMYLIRINRLIIQEDTQRYREKKGGEKGGGREGGNRRGMTKIVDHKVRLCLMFSYSLAHFFFFLS